MIKTRKTRILKIFDIRCGANEEQLETLERLECEGTGEIDLLCGQCYMGLMDELELRKIDDN
jgi:hypothetical protein